MIRFVPAVSHQNASTISFTMLVVVLCCITIAACGNDTVHSDMPKPSAHTSNWYRHDRSYDRLALDHGHNLLDSCAPNAILFTQGDNDTYPLWYLQQVTGYRTDIVIINLSILNTAWYIRQLRDSPLPILSDITDDFIDRRLSGGLSSYTTLKWTTVASKMTAADISWSMPSSWNAFDNSYGMLSVAHYMLVHIIDTVTWSRPLYFSSAVSAENRIGLDEYMVYEGLVFRLTPDRSETGTYRFDTAVLEENLTRAYRMDSIIDPDVYKSPDTMNTLAVYYGAYRALMDSKIGDDTRTEPDAILKRLSEIAAQSPQWQRYHDAAQANQNTLERNGGK